MTRVRLSARQGCGCLNWGCSVPLALLALAMLSTAGLVAGVLP